MKLIIAGSRNLGGQFIRHKIFQELLNIGSVTEVLSGGCNGVDLEGEAVARFMDLPIRRFLPDWKTHGKAAGPIRNAEMAKEADVLLVVWNVRSRGSRDMIQKMRALNKPVYEVIVDI